MCEQTSVRLNCMLYPFQENERYAYEWQRCLESALQVKLSMFYLVMPCGCMSEQSHTVYVHSMEYFTTWILKQVVGDPNGNNQHN